MTEREIFLALLDLPDAAARAAYLDRACGGDAVLRARVEALLRSHETAGNFLDHPAVAPLPPDSSPTQALDRQATPDEDAHSADDALSFLHPPSRPDSLGRLGHYEILELLGRGGFGIVFRAFDEVLHRVVAVKVLAPQLAANSPARKRFLREARSSARVRHENVVHIYAVEEQPLPYLVMEFIPGETLQQRLDRTGPLEVSEVLHIGRQIAEGLAAAHGTGLIHRDIKPTNILLEAAPQLVKITDFGLARTADDASLTHSGIVAGTPMFMSPEQARGETLDHRADLFSLGSVLYTMCAGRPPFRASSTLAVLKRVAEDTPRPIPEIIPEVPAWLCDIITRLHAKRPEDRFASAREVADLLARCQTELKEHGTVQPSQATRPPDRAATESVRPPLARPRYRWAIAAGLLLLLGLGLAEATGVSNVRGTVIRVFSPHGTLVVEVDDPAVSVTIDGEELIITGTGAKEIRLRPGEYKVKASKDGKTLRDELVMVARNGKQVVRVSRETRPLPADAALWERSVAALSPEEQVKAVIDRLKQLNSGFDGEATPTIENGAVTGLRFSAQEVTDISPVRALRALTSLNCVGVDGQGKLADLAPLRGMRLTNLACNNTSVADLSPLQGMPLKELAIQHTRVTTLRSLADMPLLHVNCSHTSVADLGPLKGMKLISVYLDNTKVTDLTPLTGMPLRIMNCRSCKLEKGRARVVVRSLSQLEEVNSDPVAEFLKNLDDDRE